MAAVPDEEALTPAMADAWRVRHPVRPGDGPSERGQADYGIEPVRLTDVTVETRGARRQ
jgi:hypothetical protein